MIQLIILLIGIFMMSAPKILTKKELRTDQESIKKIRRNGLIITIIVIVEILLEVILKGIV